MRKQFYLFNIALAFILFASWNLSAQEYHFTEGFVASSTPDGWTTQGVSYSSSATNAANQVVTDATYCAKMKTDLGDAFLQAPKVFGAGTFSFWCKVKAPDTSPTVIIQTSGDGENWTDHTVNPAGLDLSNSTEFQNVIVPLDIPGEVIVRIYVSSLTPGLNTTGTLTVDDIQLTKPAVAANDVLLSSLTVGGALIEGFEFEITNYDAEVLYFDDYQVDATPNNSKATVDITQITEIDGSEAERTATVVVTGEDGTSTATITIVITRLDVYYREGFGDASTGNLIMEDWESSRIYQSPSGIPADAPNIYPGPAGLRFTGGLAPDFGMLLSPKLANVGTLKFWLALQKWNGGESLKVLLLKEGADSVELVNIDDTQLSELWQEVTVEINEADSVQIKFLAVCDNSDSENRIWIDDLLLTRLDPAASIQSQHIAPPVTLYPNPVQTSLNISMPENSYNSVEVFNIMGQKVLEESLKTGKSSLNVKALNKGIYMISFCGKSGKYTSKFIKE